VKCLCKSARTSRAELRRGRNDGIGFLHTRLAVKDRGKRPERLHASAETELWIFAIQGIKMEIPDYIRYKVGGGP
jgi:hypothetical protein